MIKRILFKLLGAEQYLRFVSRIFFLSLDSGLLRGKPAFYNHYFVKRFVPAGGTVIDIGANVGYYSVLLARAVGPKGKVLSVEPVQLFRNVLERNCRLFTQVTVLPYALGEESGKQVTMGIPGGHKVFRHGLTRVMEENDSSQVLFSATMKTPAEVFGSLDRLDFIKCDVEGYEIHILPLMMDLIGRFKPVIQIETGGENRKKIVSLLRNTGYVCYWVEREKLRAWDLQGEGPDADLVFIPADKPDLADRINNN